MSKKVAAKKVAKKSVKRPPSKKVTLFVVWPDKYYPNVQMYAATTKKNALAMIQKDVDNGAFGEGTFHIYDGTKTASMTLKEPECHMIATFKEL